MTMTLSSIAALGATMFVLSVVPGPSDVAVVARSIASGFRQGLNFTIGVIIAEALFIVLAAASLTALTENATPWFAIVKYAGAAFLIWMGINAIRAPVSEPSVRGNQISSRSSFLSGLFITLGDPKAILFYFGLLPTFVDLVTATVADYLVVLLTATLVIGIVKLGYAWLGSRATIFFSDATAQRRLNIFGGCVLIGTGLFLIGQS